MKINANLINMQWWKTVMNLSGCLCMTNDLFHKQQAPIIYILVMNLGEDRDGGGLIKRPCSESLSSQVSIIIATY